jgi:5-methylcytosine-specific restriction endonuclease McrA
MTPAKREAVRMMFGGRCAYCGCELSNKWHVDHIEPLGRKTAPVMNASGYGYQTTKAGFTKYRSTGKARNPHNDMIANCFPACIKCNILKADTNVEGFRRILTYFAESIPRIANYSHVHHLMRFGKLTINPTPVVFWFEQYRAGERDA